MAHALASASKNTIHATYGYSGPDTRVLLVGLGGQGIALAADIIVLVAAEAGAYVATQNVHGMAQRGESVYSMLAFGTKQLALGVGEATQDFLVGLETTEALRYQHHLKPDGLIITNDVAEAPISCFVGNDVMPPKPRKILKQLGAWVINAEDQARLMGNDKVQNIILLGALAQKLPFPQELWLDAISRVVDPHYSEINCVAFKRGFQLKQR